MAKKEFREMRVGKNTQNFNIASCVNEETYEVYYKRLQLLAMTMFEWDGLPDSVSERFMELALFNMGKALFFYDDAYGFLCLKVAPGDMLNVYEEPTKYQAYSVNYSKIYDADDCVLIRNNYISMPTDIVIRQYAYRLYEAERTMDVNIKAQKTPVLITGPDNLKLSLKNIWMKVTGNEPVIFTSKGFDPAMIKTLNVTAPFVTDKVNDYKQSIWNEALAFLGIGNIRDKQERLIVSEVTATNEQSSMNAYTMLKTRQQACDLINRKYGLNVSVRLRSDIKALERQQVLVNNRGGFYGVDDGGEVMKVGD